MASNKKGISPLIATVLIIGFTVALAAVIMVWGQGFIKGMQEKTEAGADVQLTCAQDVVVAVSDACIIPAVAPAVPTQLKVTVKNDGNKDLSTLTLRVYESASKIATVNLGALTAFGVNTFTATPTGITVGSIQQVEVVPQVMISGKPVACAQSAAIFPSGAMPGKALELCQ